MGFLEKEYFCCVCRAPKAVLRTPFCMQPLGTARLLTRPPMLQPTEISASLPETGPINTKGFFQPVFFRQSSCPPCAETSPLQRSFATSSSFCYCFRVRFAGSKEEEMDFTADRVRGEVTSSRDGEERAVSFPAGQERAESMAW